MSTHLILQHTVSTGRKSQVLQIFERILIIRRVASSKECQKAYFSAMHREIVTKGIAGCDLQYFLIKGETTRNQTMLE